MPPKPSPGYSSETEQPAPPTDSDSAATRSHRCIFLPAPLHIHISIARQRLVLHGAERPFSATISTGKAGTGFEANSGRTPTGRFSICSRHGINAPLLTTFRSRIPTGTLHAGETGDTIITRILCLDGLDTANANTRSRYIYLHGTPHTAQLGTPASHGCIRLLEANAKWIFDNALPGTKVVVF